MLPPVPQWVWIGILIYAVGGIFIVQSPHVEADRLMTYFGNLFKIVGVMIIIDRLDDLIRVLGTLVIIFSANG